MSGLLTLCVCAVFVSCIDALVSCTQSEPEPSRQTGSKKSGGTSRRRSKGAANPKSGANPNSAGGAKGNPKGGGGRGGGSKGGGGSRGGGQSKGGSGGYSRGGSTSGTQAAAAAKAAAEEDAEAAAAAAAPLTFDEKKALSVAINKLDQANLTRVVEIIQARMPLGIHEEEIELDIDAMDTLTLRDLQKFILDVGFKGRSRKGSRGRTSAPSESESESEAW